MLKNLLITAGTTLAVLVVLSNVKIKDETLLDKLKFGKE
jgi:hypothetical protein